MNFGILGMEAIACFWSGTNIIIGYVLFSQDPIETSFMVVDFYYISEYEFPLKSVLNFNNETHTP